MSIGFVYRVANMHCTLHKKRLCAGAHYKASQVIYCYQLSTVLLMPLK